MRQKEVNQFKAIFLQLHLLFLPQTGDNLHTNKMIVSCFSLNELYINFLF